MKNKLLSVDIGGLPVTPFKSMNEAVAAVCGKTGVLPGFAIAINAEKVIEARDNAEVRERLLSGSLLFADGISVVKTLAQKGRKNTRIPGCELWEHLMYRAAKLDKSVYLLGANERTNQITAQKLKEEVGLKRLKRRNGYFDSEQIVIDDILSFKPSIVTVALGSPKQELLIAKLREIHPQAFYMGVGGSYDVFTGNVKRAPAWARKFHIEWLYRLISQPSRLFRQAALVRYLWLHFSRKL